MLLSDLMGKGVETIWKENDPHSLQNIPLPTQYMINSHTLTLFLALSFYDISIIFVINHYCGYPIMHFIPSGK
jgi:hypothetical protein